MSTFISANVAHFSACFTSYCPANMLLSEMTETQQITLAQKIRCGQADALFKVMQGPVSEEEEAARKAFFANPIVQWKLVKGWIHGTMRELAIIDAIKESGVVLTADVCNKIWHVKFALILDTFQYRPETMCVLPLLKNLAIQSKLDIISWSKFVPNIWENADLQKLYIDVILASDFNQANDVVTSVLPCMKYLFIEPKLEIVNSLKDLQGIWKNKKFQIFCIDVIAHSGFNPDANKSFMAAVFDATKADDEFRCEVIVAENTRLNTSIARPQSPQENSKSTDSKKVRFAESNLGLESDVEKESAMDLSGAPNQGTSSITSAKITTVKATVVPSVTSVMIVSIRVLELIAYPVAKNNLRVAVEG